MAIDYREVADDRSPSTAGFGIEGGKATMHFLVDDDELDDAILDLLGDVETAGDGSLKRVLPKAHPRFPWLFCSSISNIQGLQAGESEPAEPDLEAPALDSFGVYDQYLLTVDFTPRPYAVLEDASITASTVTKYDEDGVSTSPKYATEWDRFTSYEITPQPELITAQQGQTVFHTSSGAPDGVAFSGFPKMLVPQSSVIYRWFQVPASYIDSPRSYLTKYPSYINQKTWDDWPAGSLLYLGCAPRRYTPPMPKRIQGPGGTGFSTERLVDIELRFLHTSRTVTSAPTPTNPNWIAAGHNCPPWLTTRKFYYAENNSSTAANKVPTFLSVPFELLFTDPDA